MAGSGDRRGDRPSRALALGMILAVLVSVLAAAHAGARPSPAGLFVAEWGLGLAVLGAMVGLLWIAWPGRAPIWPFVLIFGLGEPVLLHLLLRAHQGGSAFGALAAFWAMPLPLVAALSWTLLRRGEEAEGEEGGEA